MAARVDSLLAGDGLWVPPLARDAATVCLLRDTESGPEVFVLRRKATMAFAALMHVYPGGAVESSDADVPTTSYVEDAWLDARTLSNRGRAVLVAAARETFEECGVLLAVDASGTPAAHDERLELERQALLKDEVAFIDVLGARGLVVDGSVAAYGVARPCVVGYKLGPVVARSSDDAARVLSDLGSAAR